MIKLEFPADRPDIAAILGGALLQVAELGGVTVSKEYEGQLVTSEKPAKEGPTADPKPETGASTGAPIAEADTTPTTAAAAEPEAAPQQVERDHNGVPFNDEFCGKATDPFYSSGPRLGSWKKKRGVSEFDYDAWYRDELAKLQGGTTAPADEQTDGPGVDAAAAFSGGQSSQPAPEPQQQTQQPAPKHVGELMVWVSERQAAGVLEQSDVQAAYDEAGVDVGKLFGPQGVDYVPAVFEALQRRVKQ